MTDNKIGVNSKGIDKDIILSKEIGTGFGKGAEARQKALDTAATNKGSELVYEKEDGWHVSELKEKTVITASGSLSKEDSSDIKLYTENMGKLGISAAIISFSEDDFNSLADSTVEDKVKVAGNPASPPEIIKQLAGDKYYSVRTAVAAGKAASPEILEKLSTDTDYRVRVSVAGNPATPKEVLQKLAYAGLDDEPANPYLFKVQAAAAANPYIPAEALRALFARGSFNKELSANPSTPDDILKKIFN